MYTSLQRVSNVGTAFLKAIKMAICMAEGGGGGGGYSRNY